MISQGISIADHVEKVIIKKDTSFLRDVSVILKESEETTMYPIFYDSELEKVSNIQVYFKKGKRFKLQKDNIILEDDVELEYVASKRVKSIVIPPRTESKITYNVDCKELMYFTSLRFFSNNPIDTLRYDISVPNEFQFIYNMIYKDSLGYIKIDSSTTNNLKNWNIEAIPQKIEPDPLAFFGIYRNKRVPLMRTLITPSSYKGKEVRYMNDWYLKKIESRRGLNPQAIHEINKLTEGINEPTEILDVLYDYVKNNFKYVAIEIGMGAFIPSHVNEVFSNKEGDCKDLSNFLSEALNYKGIKSHVALTATFDHISDCDFPSLGSANHVVCVAYLDKIPIILDPTDPIHFPLTPVQSIQNRTLYIVSPNGSEWHTAQRFTPQQNLIEYEIDLKEDSNKMLMIGQFNARYHGISGNFLRRQYSDLDNKKTNITLKKHFKSLFGNQSILDFNLLDKTDVVDVKGEIHMNGKIINDVDNRILFIDFLPKPWETQQRDKLLVGTHLESNLSKKIRLRIEMNESFGGFEPIVHLFAEKGVSFSLKINAASDSALLIDYEFLCDYDLVSVENSKALNTILTSFKKVINDPIILKSKG